MSAPSNNLTTARIACRVPIFAPTRRPTKVTNRRIETSWGWAVITGRLAQNHRDIVDAVRLVALTWYKEGSHGDICALCDSTRLRAELGWERWTYQQILKGLNDLLDAKIRASFPQWTDTTHILIRVREFAAPPLARRKKGAIKNIRRKRRQDAETEALAIRGGALWEITFSGAWVALFKDLPMTYPARVFSMQSGVAQAISRFMLSHGPGARYGVATAFAAVGMPEERHIRRRALEGLSRDMEAMAEVGVNYNPTTGMLTTGGRLTPIATGKAEQNGTLNPDSRTLTPDNVDAQPR